MNGIRSIGSMLTPDSSYTRRCLSATRCTPILSPVRYARSSSSLSCSSRGWCGASAAELRSCLIENGSSSSRASTVPAMIVWNHGIPVETFTSSSIHEERPAGDHPVSPSAVRSPYWRGVSAASVSSVSDGGRAATCVTASSAADGIEGGVAATGAGVTSSGTRVSDGGVGVGDGGASAFFEKSHMLRVASGSCACSGGLGKRLTRWYEVQRSTLLCQ
jgi:hypothetical protein